MAKSIQIARRSIVEVPDISSYRLVIEAVNPQDMPGKIFINQRIRNFAKGSFDYVFAAVCTPTQLEDLAEDSPEEGTSYYRTDRVDIIARTPEVLETIFNSLLYEVKKLVIDLTDLESLADTVVYNVSANEPITQVP